MNRKTQRLLCRTGFVLLCVVPTLLVLLWIVWPNPKSRWEAELSKFFGLNVSLDAVLQPRPGVTVFAGVALTDRESGIVARSNSIEATQTSDGLVLIADGVEVRADQLHSIKDLIRDRLLRGPSLREGTITLRTRELEVTQSAKASPHASSSNKSMFRDVVMQFDRSKDGSRLTVVFRRVDQPTSELCEFRVERKQPSNGHPATKWFLNTQRNYVACRMIEDALPEVRMLGENCEFSGLIWSKDSETGSQGEVNGRFRNVDLSQLVEAQFAHTLRGIADVELRRATFRDGRLVDAAGSLTCSGGLIGNELLDAADHSLSMKSNRGVNGSHASFRRLALSFQIDQSMLSIRGQCDDRGAIAIDEQGRALLVESPQANVPVLALVRTLVPNDNLQVPFTTETATLLSIFPAPSASRAAPPSERTASPVIELDTELR